MGNAFTRLEEEPSEPEPYDESKFLIDRTKLHCGYVISKSENSLVYEGTYMNKPVAIKVMQKGTNVSPERKEQFRRQIRLYSGVQNDNIVKFIGFSMEPALTIVTEIMKGGSLQKYLWTAMPCIIDPRESFVMALEISRAMEYLHANGIIHRDLKPNNIFLSESKKHVKLGDFTLCREGLEGDFTADVGSYRWMAPEVYSREQHEIARMTTRYNHKVDVYSFGIVLWELLTNKSPFEGMDNKMIAKAVLNNERPTLNVAHIPPDIRDLLQCCWASDPRDRLEFWQISSFLEDILNGLNPGWDTVPPSIIESRMEDTSFMGLAKKYSERLFGCFPRCLT